MKKLLIICVAFAMVLGCAGCSAAVPSASSQSTLSLSSFVPAQDVSDPSTPQGAVQTALDALKSLNFETYNQYTDNAVTGRFKITSGNGAETAGLRALMESIFKNLSYQVGEPVVNGDTATVPAAITNADMSDIMSGFIKSVLKDALSNPADYDPTDLEVLQKLSGYIEQEQGEAVTTYLELALQKEESGWRLQTDEDFVNAVCGNMFSQVDGLDEIGEWNFPVE